MVDYAAIAGNPLIEELVIPEGVTEINNSGFIDNTGLKKITLPSTLESIWEKAFKGCSSLEEITIPERISYISDDVFDGCTSLRRIRMKSSLVKGNYFAPKGARVLRKRSGGGSGM